MDQKTTNQNQGEKQPPAPQQGGSGLLYGGIAILLLLVLGGAYLYLSGGDAMNDDTGSDTEQDTTTNEVPDPVAVVNGEEISSDEYNAALAQLRASAGGQLSEDELQQQAIDTLVSNTLLSQAISESGTSADESEIDAQVATLVEQTGGEEAFTEQLAAVDLTIEEVRAQIAEQLAAEAYIRENVNLESITVSEDDVTAFYEQLSAQNEEIAPLADVREQIEAQLTAQAQQALVQQYLDTLRAGATVEVFVGEEA